MYLKPYDTESMLVADVPARAGLVLRPYQEIGRDWLYEGKRKILKDDAGLGKTIMASEAAVRPCLITCPTYLAQQWYDHIRKQYPGDSITIATGATMHRFDRQARLRKKRDWYIVNHEMMRSNEYRMPANVKTVIVDEFHHFRNRTAQKSIGLAKLCSNMDTRVYGLTATPMWKNTDDIWMQLHILQPEIFSSYNEFVDTFMIVDESMYGPKILGIKRSVRAELESMLSIVMMGRTYKQVGRYLPSTITSQIKIDFPKELMDKYKELRRKYRLQLEEDETLIFSSYIEVLHVLRALTNFGGKQRALLDRLEDVGKPALIFTWYKEHALQLHKLIAGSRLLTGDVAPTERMQIANEASRKGQTVVATVHSLSEGVNLQGYRHVIFYERDWAPGRNHQALSRVVRDRNDGGYDKEPVLVDDIMVTGSVDTIIYGVANQREVSIKDLMKSVLGSL